jgi:hypothetical protein
VVALAEGLAEDFLLQHGEVIGHDEVNLLLRPVNSGLFLVLLLHGLALPDDGEPELPQDEVGLTGGLAAAELVGLTDLARPIAARQADDGLGRLSLAFVYDLVPGRWAERVDDPRVQAGQRLLHVFLRQGWRDGLRYGGLLHQSPAV